MRLFESLPFFLQKKHALRCYCQAMQVYKGKGWSLAEDHINFTIGRQSFTLRQMDNAVSAFRHILINDSKQPPAQQGAFLREYLYVYKVYYFLVSVFWVKSNFMNSNFLWNHEIIFCLIYFVPGFFFFKSSWYVQFTSEFKKLTYAASLVCSTFIDRYKYGLLLQ